MAKGKTFPLSIVLRAIDKATAPIRRVNAEIRRVIPAVKRLNTRLRTTARVAGLPQLAKGFRGVATAARGVATRVAGVAVAAGFGVAGLKSMIAAGDNLAKRADRVGLTVDAYAQLRFAAGQSGTEIARFDSALEGFAKRVGEAKAGTGSLNSFLKLISPTLLKQVKATKGTEEAFELMVRAMGKVESPTKRAALASAAFGRSGLTLLNFFKEGPKGIAKLRKEYADTAGSQEEAARKSEKMQDALGRISAATDGVKAAILIGLAPAFLQLSEGLKKFLVENREAIAEWAKDFGEKLPGRIARLGKFLQGLGRAIKPVWDAIGGFGGAVKILAAIIVGKLAFAFLALGKAMLFTPFGQIVTAIGLVIAIGNKLGVNWSKLGAFFVDLWGGIKRVFVDAYRAIKFVLMNFTPLGLIVRNWKPIGDFFARLWSGITAGLNAAWKGIKFVVGKIIAAAEKIIGVVKEARDFFSNESDVFDPTKIVGVGKADIGAGFQPANIGERVVAGQTIDPSHIVPRMEVVFKNTPTGTKVNLDRDGRRAVDLSVGYLLGFE